MKEPRCDFCKKKMDYDNKKDVWHCKKDNFYKVIGSGKT